MDKIKDISRRGSILLVTAVFLGAWLSTLPVVAFADIFFNSEFANRILLLSSSSPGWSYTDGAGNTTFAQPGSGPNGKQTAEQFNLVTNSDNSGAGKHILGMSFQYCTAAAGNCYGPGNDTFVGTPGSYTAENGDDTTAHSDLNVAVASQSEAASSVVGTAGDPGVLIDSTTGKMLAQPTATTTGANFVVLYQTGGTWTYSANWSMSVTNQEDGTLAAGTHRAKNNYITLTNSSTGIATPSGTPLEIVFFATNTNYITNPGQDAFFVKMADYHDASTLDSTTIMDGGVTVANVMTQSIQITTKVLETMSFSVGITDPYTQAGTHGGCDPLLGTSTDYPGGPTNGIALGDPTLEYSLATNKASDAWSLWRLSTNSAFGGTVYYSGDTLRSTEDTTIDPIGTTAKQALFGSNQFGLALDTQYPTYAAGVFTAPGKHTYYDLHPLDASYGTQYQTSQSGSSPWPQFGLESMAAQSPYNLGGGDGTANGGSIIKDGTGTNGDPSEGDGAHGPSFAFASNANTSPQAIATQANNVIQCATGQVRYLADVAGYTAAGIYTTKINYLAAPEF
jgi:hypothetical protein